MDPGRARRCHCRSSGPLTCVNQQAFKVRPGSPSGAKAAAANRSDSPGLIPPIWCGGRGRGAAPTAGAPSSSMLCWPSVVRIRAGTNPIPSTRSASVTRSPCRKNACLRGLRISFKKTGRPVLRFHKVRFPRKSPRRFPNRGDGNAVSVLKRLLEPCIWFLVFHYPSFLPVPLSPAYHAKPYCRRGSGTANWTPRARYGTVDRDKAFRSPGAGCLFASFRKYRSF